MKQLLNESIAIDLLCWSTAAKAIKNFSREHLVDFLYLIIRMENQRANSTGFVAIHNRYFKDIVSPYSGYLQLLIDHGVIERDEVFIKGKKSYWYRTKSIYHEEPAAGKKSRIIEEQVL